MPQIKDIDLLWNNNYESGSIREEEISRIPFVRHDSMQSYEAGGVENTIKMLESRIL